MEFSRLIFERNSIREYASAIPHDDLVAVLKQAQRAPSWKNQQTSRCYVVESKELVDSIRQTALPSFNCRNTANAALIITTFVKGNVGFNEGDPVNEIGDGWGAYDNGLSNAYLILKARAMGFDTLIMGMRFSDRIRAEFNIPEEEEIMAVIALGYRAEEPSRPARRDLDEVARFF